jgi:hypothetical protein
VGSGENGQRGTRKHPERLGSEEADAGGGEDGAEALLEPEEHSGAAGGDDGTDAAYV